MKFTSLVLYPNTPFIDFNNYVNKGSNEARDLFFDTHFNQQVRITKTYDFIRDRGVLRINMTALALDFNFMSQVNYVRLESDFEPNITYYAQVVDSRYENGGTYSLNLVIDGFTTFAQGDISQYTGNNRIERQHLTNDTFNNNLQYLRTNSDVLNYSNLNYVSQDLMSFVTFSVIFRASVDLSKDYGDKDDPTQSTSKGIRYDKITSPQDLYYVNLEQFNDLMGALSDYPWIAQNITNVQVIPDFFIDKDDLVNVDMPVDFDGLKTFKNGGSSAAFTDDMFSTINQDMSEIINRIGDVGHPELLRQPYANIEMTNWQGQSVEIDPAYLPDEGLQFKGQGVSGYANGFYIFPWKYKADGENHIDGLYSGAYLNNAISFNTWDNIPVLIDNYKLDMASNAHQRAYAQSNLLSGQLNMAANPDNNVQDRFMAGVNLLSDVSVKAMQGKLTDEWQFYRQQQAQFADKKISKPSVDEQSTNNAFPIKHQTFGITVKYSRLPSSQQRVIAAYHANYGYAWNATGKIDSIMSMSHMNYFKFDGVWTIPGVPFPIMQQMRAQAAAGVKAWHNPDNLENPFTQDITELNERVI